MKMFATCFSTAPIVNTSCDAMAVRTALGHQAEHLGLPGRELFQRAVRLLAGEELPHDLRVERGAAAGDSAHGADEVVDLHDPVLEQVADAALASRKKLRRISLLDVL